MNTVVQGLFAGALIGLALVLYSMVVAGVETFGRDWRSLMSSSWKLLKDSTFRKPASWLVVWCAIHGTVVGIATLGGIWPWAVGSGAILYLILAMIYRQWIGGKGGRKTWLQWKTFWEVREAVPLLKKTDQRSYNTFYIVSMCVGVFWAYIGLFDFAK